jgi:hypothetical protein
MGMRAQTQTGQAAGCGCLALIGLLVIGFWMSGGVGGAGTSVSIAPAPPPADSPVVAERTTVEVRDGLYIHGTVEVRAEPRSDAAILRTLNRGDYVHVGPADANGWAKVYSGATYFGYVYRASSLIQPTPPFVDLVSPGTRPSPEAESRVYIRGPKGGCYYINRNKNKQYVDRSMCN